MKIIFVSDTHLTARSPAFNGNWTIVSEWISAQRPDQVIHLGDITADGVDYPEELEFARPMFDTLGCPVSFVPGNHDIGDNPVAPGAKTKQPLNLERLRQYENLFGSACWVLNTQSWRLLGINAELLGTGTPNETLQFDWISEQLQGHNGPVGLFLHKPLFRTGPSDTEVHLRYLPLDARAQLLQRLAGADLRFVVSGHAHQTRRFVVDGIEHVWAPSTAFLLPDSMQERIGEKVLGLLTLEITESGHQFDLITPALTPHSLLNFANIYPDVSSYQPQSPGLGSSQGPSSPPSSSQRPS